jgi:GAF domain-containing protein
LKAITPQETVKVLQNILEIDQRSIGIKYLRALAKNIAQILGFKYVLIGHALEPDKQRVETDVVWAAKGYIDNFEYDLKNTPCENVLSGKRVCIYPNSIIQQFPEDVLLADMGVESYIGAPVLTVDGKLSGILVLLDDGPIEDGELVTAIVDFLASRVGTEIERHYIEENLKRLVVERTAELEQSNKDLKLALSEIKILQGIIPICSHCKKVRDDRGFWQQVESYISEHSEASFSHGVCPQCFDEVYGDLIKTLKT